MDEKENRLVELVLSGHTQAFEALVTPYRSSLLGLAQRLTGNIEEAKEAGQETLLKAFRYLRSFDREKSFKNWLLGILVNVSRSQAKKRKEMTPTNSALFDSQAVNPHDPARLHQQKELRGQIMDCLNVLSRGEREVFLLRDIEEQTIRETSRILGCSSLSVRVRLSSARKKIKERLSPALSGKKEIAP